MKFEGERRIAADRMAVYEALNDTDILRQSIPGCESLEKISDTSYDALVALKIGPIRAKFKGSVALENLNPPVGYTLVGEGKGGTAGFANGKADVRLDEDSDGTLLAYNVQAALGGKIAQLGSRLVQGTAKKLSGEFFDTFAGLVETGTGSPAVEATPVTPDEKGGTPTWLWWVVGGAVLLAMIAFALS